MWLRVLRWSRRYPTGAVGALFVLITLLVAMFGAEIAPYSFKATEAANKWAQPSMEHWFGTDVFGRDVLSRLLVGARGSVVIGLAATLAGIVIGAVFGIVSGYKGGLLDILLQRVVDVVMPIPSLILALLFVVVLGATFPTLIVSISLPRIPSTIRVMRAVTLSVKENSYVDAARSVGSTDIRIMLRHILPNAFAPLLILFSGYIGVTIVAESSLSFLGLGIPPPMATWGGDLNRAVPGLKLNAWASIGPGLFLSMAVFGFNLLGDGLRDSFDPRLKQA